MRRGILKSRMSGFAVLAMGGLTMVLAGCGHEQTGTKGPSNPAPKNEEPYVAQTSGGSGSASGGSASIAEIRNLVAAGRCSEALVKIEAVETKRADKFYYKGVCLMQQGKMPEAGKAFDLALKYKPDFPEKYVNAAGLFIQQGKAAKAMALLEEAAKRFPREASLWFNLGLARLSTGRLHPAAEAFERAASAAPSNKKYQVASGIAWLKLRSFAKAKARFEKAIQLAPSSADAAEGLARCYGGLGKKLDAVKWARKAVSLDPKSLGRRHLLAGLLLDAGKAAEAVQILEDLTARLPNKAVVFLRLAQAQEKAGAKAKSLATLKTAAEKSLHHPTSPKVMLEIAAELERRGQRRLAERLRTKVRIPRPASK